jgi:uncharacterized protein
VPDSNRDGSRERFLLWRVVETAGFESAWAELDGPALRAAGHAAGQLPEPYWLTYTLETDAAGLTARLLVTARTSGARDRRLDLGHRVSAEASVTAAEREAGPGTVRPSST